MSEEVKNEVVKSEEGGLLNYMDSVSLNRAYKNAQVLAKSDLMPDTYKNRPENVMIAMDLASRSGFSLMLVMQNLTIVRGRPTWAGQFCLAAIKGCGRYSNIKYVWLGEEGSDNYGCYLQATEIATGETVKGSAVTWKMVKGEGWLQKSGSKWATMPEQMFKYRAAAFFARTECPDVLMGLQTADEVQDVRGYEAETAKKTTVKLDDIYVESEVQ